MGLIAIDNLTAGMILASDVLDRSGRLLLGAGVELAEKHLRIFRAWGVVEADIAGMESDEECKASIEMIDPELLAAAEAEVAALFRHADLDHPCMSQLLHLALRRKAQHASL